MYDTQTLINTLVGAVLFLAGLVADIFRRRLSHMASDHTAMLSSHNDLKNKVQEIEVLVAGKYLTREEQSIENTILYEKIDKIIDMLGNMPCKETRRPDRR